MPIHSAGYRAWEGNRVPGATRWAVIASTGVRRTWKSAWLRRLIFASILPMVVLSIPLFLFEQAVQTPTAWRDVVGFLSGAPFWQPPPSLDEVLKTDFASAGPEEIANIRHEIWAYLILTMFEYPQAVLMVMVIGIAAPPLISHDVRSRAFLVYFARPITRTEYIAGKMATLVFFLALITTLPAMILYSVGVLLSPDLSVIGSTWDIPFRIVGASLMLMLPTCSLALMFSSMTRESRYAGFVWYVMWIIGFVTFSIVMSASAVSPRHYQNPDIIQELSEPGLRSLLSPYHTLTVVQEWMFGMASEHAPVIPAAVILIIITLVSLGILHYRVSAPMRA